MRQIILLAALLVQLASGSAIAQDPFDHQHQAWSTLLKKHVVLTDGGKASQLRYTGMQQDRGQLKAYLASLSKVSDQEFKG